MRLIRGLHNIKANMFASGSVITIGNYDGVHLGHREVLDFTMKTASELKLPAVIIIFEPQPDEFFAQNKQYRLTSLRDKLLLFGGYSPDYVLVLSFNSNLAQYTAKRFVNDILVNSLNVRQLVIGDDFVFGRSREGGYQLLEQEGKLHGFQVRQIPAFKIDGVRVSSTLIRTALLHGDLDLAPRLLGIRYRVCGKVVHGEHRGRDLGFPTANIHLKNDEHIMSGVYAVKVYGLASQVFCGIANVGFRPTVLGKSKTFEVYIFDFDSDIYGKRLTVEFYKKIRDERKFTNFSGLKTQIEKDLLVVKEVLGYS